VIDVILVISLYYIALGEVRSVVFSVLSVSHAGEVTLLRVAKYVISSGDIHYFEWRGNVTLGA